MVAVGGVALWIPAYVGIKVAGSNIVALRSAVYLVYMSV